jgi:hypothetical protein
MWYTIICEDVENSLSLRKSVRSAHLQRLQKLSDQGQLLTAGPHPAIDSQDPGENGFTGSLVIAEFVSQEAAQHWANEDPYVAAGVFSKVVVKPYKKVF